MRKLLILTVVLGIASLAMATPTITVSNATPAPGDTIEVYISGTAAEASTDGVSGTGGWSGNVAIDYANYGTAGGSPYLTLLQPATAIETAAGSMASSSTSSQAAYMLAAAGVPWTEATDVDTGLWFTFDVTVDGVEGDIETIDIGNWGTSPLASVTVTIIPEPMTMALLGLGGLFLRRRK